MEASAAPRPAFIHRRPARLLRLSGDDRLVAEVRAGSEAAFEVVYDRHHRGILGFCRHMLGSQEEAEDAVQHTFMAAYRDLMGSDKPIQLSAWLYTIARNRCLTVLRARRERPSDEIDKASFEGLASEVERRQDLRDIVRDVGQLPEDQRAALVLAELGDVSHDEIAVILDVPKAKVKALVFQARSSLTASRLARDTPCEEIREQLANLRGGSLRRTTLRRHLNECAGCRAFRTEMDTQRKALAVALPVIPAIGLKEGVLSAVLGGGSGGAGAVAAAGAGAGAGATTFGGGLVAKALVVAAVAGGGAAGVSAVAGGGSDAPSGKPGLEQGAADRSQSAAGGGGSAGGSAPAGAPGAGGGAADDDDGGRGDRESSRARNGKRGLGAREGDKSRDRDKGRSDSAGEREGKKGKKGKGGSPRANGPKKARDRARTKAKVKNVKQRGAAKRSPKRSTPKRSGANKPRRTPEAKPVKTPQPTPTATPVPTATPTPVPDLDDEDDRRGNGDGDGKGKGLPIPPIGG